MPDPDRTARRYCNPGWRPDGLPASSSEPRSRVVGANAAGEPASSFESASGAAVFAGQERKCYQLGGRSGKYRRSSRSMLVRIYGRWLGEPSETPVRVGLWPGLSSTPRQAFDRTFHSASRDVSAQIPACLRRATVSFHRTRRLAWQHPSVRRLGTDDARMIFVARRWGDVMAPAISSV